MTHTRSDTENEHDVVLGHAVAYEQFEHGVGRLRGNLRREQDVPVPYSRGERNTAGRPLRWSIG